MPKQQRVEPPLFFERLPARRPEPMRNLGREVTTAEQTPAERADPIAAAPLLGALCYDIGQKHHNVEVCSEVPEWATPYFDPIRGLLCAVGGGLGGREMGLGLRESLSLSLLVPPPVLLCFLAPYLDVLPRRLE